MIKFRFTRITLNAEVPVIANAQLSNLLQFLELEKSHHYAVVGDFNMPNSLTSNNGIHLVPELSRIQTNGNVKTTIDHFSPDKSVDHMIFIPKTIAITPVLMQKTAHPKNHDFSDHGMQTVVVDWTTSVILQKELDRKIAFEAAIDNANAGKLAPGQWTPKEREKLNKLRKAFHKNQNSIQNQNNIE